MTTFSNIFADCRNEAGLTQAAVGKQIRKSPGFISKLEAGTGQVKVPPASDKKRIIDLFRKNGIAEPKLKALETAWDDILRSGGSEKNTEEPIIQLVLKTLSELQEFDRKAFITDMDALIYMWRDYYMTTTDFLADKLSFSSAEQQYSNQLEKKGKELGTYLDPRLRLERARHRRYLAKNDEANTDLLSALETVNRIDDPKLKLRILIELGDFYRRSDDMTKSLSYYNEADQVCNLNKINTAIPKVRIASCYLVAGDPIHAMSYCEDGLKIARASGDAHLERKAVEYIAWAKAMLGYYDEALSLQFDLHMRAISSLIHPKDLAKSSCYLGGFYYLCGMFKEAEKCYQESLRYIERINEMINKDGADKEIFIKSWVLLGLARTYLNLPGKLRTADECMSESREIGEEIKDVLTIGRSDELRGRLNIIMRDYDGARSFFQSAHVRFAKAGLAEIGDETKCNPYYITSLELGFTELDFLSGRIAEAQKHVGEAENIANQYRLAGYLAMAKMWKARILIAEQDPEIEQALEIFHDTIMVSVNYGVSQLRSILETVDKHVLEIHMINTKLALQLVASMIKWEKTIQELKSTSDQAKEINGWFKKLHELHRDWEITQEAKNMIRKSAEQSGR